MKVPLSEYEQRVLNELERDLGTDPRLKGSMAHSHRSAGRLLTAGIGVVLGLVVLVVGAIAQVSLLGITGFAIMAGSVLWGLSTGPSQTPPAKATGKKKSPQGRKGLKKVFGERFDRRRERGDL